VRGQSVEQRIEALQHEVEELSRRAERLQRELRGTDQASWSWWILVWAAAAVGLSLFMPWYYSHTEVAGSSQSAWSFSEAAPFRVSVVILALALVSLLRRPRRGAAVTVAIISIILGLLAWLAFSATRDPSIEFLGSSPGPGVFVALAGCAVIAAVCVLAAFRRIPLRAPATKNGAGGDIADVRRDEDVRRGAWFSDH
jgi:hypothetical protein